MGIEVSRLNPSFANITEWNWSRVQNIIHTYTASEYDFVVDAATASTLIGCDLKEVKDLIKLLPCDDTANVNTLGLLMAIIILSVNFQHIEEDKLPAIFDLYDFEVTGSIHADEMTILFLMLHSCIASILNLKSETPNISVISKMTSDAFESIGKKSNLLISKEEFLQWTKSTFEISPKLTTQDILAILRTGQKKSTLQNKLNKNQAKVIFESGTVTVKQINIIRTEYDELFGKCDPFVILKFGDNWTNRTSTIPDGGLKVVWNIDPNDHSNWTFPVNKEDFDNTEISIIMKDENRVRSDVVLGVGELTLSSLLTLDQSGGEIVIEDELLEEKKMTKKIATVKLTLIVKPPAGSERSTTANNNSNTTDEETAEKETSTNNTSKNRSANTNASTSKAESKTESGQSKRSALGAKIAENVVEDTEKLSKGMNKLTVGKKSGGADDDDYDYDSV